MTKKPFGLAGSCTFRLKAPGKLASDPDRVPCGFAGIKLPTFVNVPPTRLKPLPPPMTAVGVMAPFLRVNVPEVGFVPLQGSSWYFRGPKATYLTYLVSVHRYDSRSLANASFLIAAPVPATSIRLAPAAVWMAPP